MDRVIFPELKLFKKTVLERMIVTMQEIYRQHPVYTFQDKEKDTGVLIYPSYADVNLPGKQPKFLIKIGGYSRSNQDTFFNNMESEYKDSRGVVSGFNYLNMRVTQATIIVQAYAEEESSNMADELNELIMFACRGMFSQMGLVVRQSQVSETDAVKREEDLFQTVITVSMDVPWSSSISSTEDPNDVDIEFEDPLDTGGEYRSPCVSTVVVNTTPQEK